MLIPLIILGICGITLVSAGIWIVFIARVVHSSSDINRVFILGWIGAALVRTFSEPQKHEWTGWKKNILGIFLIIAGLVSLYGAYSVIQIGLL
jgi:hypothetical protein